MKTTKEKQRCLDKLIDHCKKEKKQFEIYKNLSYEEKLFIRNQIANQGVEMTPKELDDIIELAYECSKH